MVGHENLAKDFKRLADGGRLSHAYLFFGEPQVGKFLFVSSFANYLENKTFEPPKNHLKETLTIAIKKEDEKESVGIDEIRSLQNFLYQKPVFSPKRTVIIRDAEDLTPEAQNAILKILEEPPAQSLIIFIANNYDNLFPTVLSRLQKIYFPRIDAKEITDFLKKNLRLSKTKAKSIAKESFGRPGRAIQLTQNFKLDKIVENSQVDEYFEFLIADLYKEPMKNYKKLKQALNTLTLMKQFNLNKKLQFKNLWSKIS
ncbi:MAG: AAA family ATPase [Patescibacteria group bacterium]